MHVALIATLTEDGSVLVKVATAIGALIVIARCWFWMAETTHNLRRIIALLPTMESLKKLEPLAEVLKKEFRQNGGSTLADKVTRIDESSAAAARKADEAKTATEKQDEVLAIIQRKTEHQDEVLERQDKVLGELTDNVNNIKETVDKLACQSGEGGCPKK